jgi:Uma2 family endonuclease
MGLPKRKTAITSAEYLVRERAAEFRSEYFAGEMFAMAGGSFRQSLIKANLVAELRADLKGRHCFACDSDLRIKVVSSGLYTYPDASVICEPIEFEDDKRDVVLNPVLVVEVLSPSTEAYDRGKKFEHYRRIPSLREYVLVSQEAPHVEHFLRNEDRTWTLTEVSGLEAKLSLPTLGIEMSLLEIFDKVDFNSDESA